MIELLLVVALLIVPPAGQAASPDAAAVARADAIQSLIREKKFDEAHAKADALSLDDPAWERLSAYLYYEASSRKDFAYLLSKLPAVASGNGRPSAKAAALVALGRTYRRDGKSEQAVASLEAAESAAPGSNPSLEARALLYDIRTLSIGLPAPAFSATDRSGRTISLDTLRGKVAVLLFWGST